MSVRAAGHFNDELNELFAARTHYLRSLVRGSRGGQTKFTKKRVRDAIERLEGIAEDGLLRSRHVRRLLKRVDYKRQWRVTKSKGHGRPAKRKSFKDWYDRKITTKNCVYAFWKRKRCLYVGRTLNGKGRPTHHFDKHWFGTVNRIDIYAFKRKRDVPRFECLFTHRHDPAYGMVTPASKKYYSVCPICDAQKEIRDEVKYLFRLR